MRTAQKLMCLFLLALLPGRSVSQGTAYSKMSSYVRNIARKQVQKPVRQAEAAGAGQSLCALVKVSGGGRATLENLGCRIQAEIGDIYVVDIPLRKLSAVSRSNDILRIEAGESRSLTMDTTRIIVGNTNVEQGLQLPQAYTGSGVVMGVMDVGFDLASPNFYDSAMTSTRIRRFWDQLSPDSLSSSLYVGADYRTEKDILAYAHSHDALIETHGVHTLGIAAGTGFGTPYRGMAPGADICLVSNAVNTDVPLIPDEQLYRYTSAADVLGFKYIFDYAEECGKPCVISFSESSTQSLGNDEQLFEEALQRLTGPGRILVSSAANEGYRKTYFHKPQAVERDGVFLFSSSRQCSISATSASPFNLCFTGYSFDGQRWEHSIPTARVVASPDSLLSDTATVSGRELILTVGAYKTYFDSTLTAYDVVAETEGGAGTHFFLSVEAEGKDADVSIYSNGVYFAADNMNTSLSGGEKSYSIGSPGCAPAVICVGATAYRDRFTNINGNPYVAEWGLNGQIAGYSSVGPTRDGRIKPDVVAPGTHIMSSVSSYYAEANTEGDVIDCICSYSDFNGRRYPWARFTGTSMSTPVVAGAIALWLEANPRLTTEQIMQVFAQTCHRYDGRQQGEKDNYYGYGEIDVYAGLLKVLQLDGIQAISSHNPAAARIRYMGNGKIRITAAEGLESPVSSTLYIYNVSGKLVEKVPLRLSAGDNDLQVGSLRQGVYVIQLTSSDDKFTGSVVVRA